MLIFATIAINVAAIAIWSAVTGGNGFAEVGKLLRGEPSFQGGPGGSIGSAEPYDPTTTVTPGSSLVPGTQTGGGRGGGGARFK